MEIGDLTGQCVHCGDGTAWIDDPSPDLCHRCAAQGLWSQYYGPERAAEYKARLARLVEKGRRGTEAG